jgi:hypothetical protein
MRRSRLVTGAVAAALLLAIVPTSTAQALQPVRSTYTVFVAIYDGVMPTERETGRTLHITEPYWYVGDAFVLVGNQWTPSGTVRTNIDQSNWSDSGGVSSGTFVVRGSALGDYDGTWAWNWGRGKDGHGVGQGVGSSTGNHLKIEFPAVDPVGLPDPPEAGAYYYMVMSTY